MQVTLCAFENRPIAGRPAILNIKCKVPTKVVVTQRSLNLFNHIVSADGVTTIDIQNADPIEIEAGDFRTTVTPLVLPCRFNYLRVKRLGVAGQPHVISWASNAPEAILQVLNDKVIEERHVLGTDKCIITPEIPGLYLAKVTGRLFTSTETAQRQFWVWAWKPSISTVPVRSGRPGGTAFHSWTIKYATEAWLEHSGRRRPVGLRDSIELPVPSVVVLVASGPGGTNSKELRSEAWLPYSMIEGGRS